MLVKSFHGKYEESGTRSFASLTYWTAIIQSKYRVLTVCRQIYRIGLSQTLVRLRLRIRLSYINLNFSYSCTNHAMKNAFSYSDYTRSKSNWNLNGNYEQDYCKFNLTYIGLSFFLIPNIFDKTCHHFRNKNKQSKNIFSKYYT